MNSLAPWESLMKRLTWRQLGDLRGLRILDFGSGRGITADHYAADNAVTAVEPDEEAVAARSRDHAYTQLTGSTEALHAFPDESFDAIFCHNVLEYAPDRANILREFARLLAPGGFVSVVKHNRPGRVFQMAVLLNNFEHANALLDGSNGRSAEYGAIRYYGDDDLTAWCPSFRMESVRGIRTFFDLQQNQAIQRDPAWQEKMLALELRVSDQEPYRSAAFLHHIILRKRGDVVIRPLTAADIAPIVAGELAQGWHATAEKYRLRLADAAAGRCIALCAEMDGEPVGYINLYNEYAAGPFVGSGWPEIVDFGVLEKARRRGVGTALMDAAERLAAASSDHVCLGVGLHEGYGAAQRLYVRRGYVPDGSGAWYRDRVCPQYDDCCNDNDLVLYMSKRLK